MPEGSRHQRAPGGETAAAAVPARLGPFVLLGTIGSGGMGTVHRARAERAVGDLPAGTEVALKVVHGDLLRASSHAGERFRREGALGLRIRHPNVVRTFGLHEIEGNGDGGRITCLAMEWVRGESLAAVLARLRRLPESLVREILAQAAEGLAAIHAAGIVHRDVKPANLVLTPDHRLVVMDLGLARLLDGGDSDLTRSGVFLGTPSFAAPEQLCCDPATPASDLYSLGVTAYVLVAGANPFDADGLDASRAAHLDRVVPPLVDAVPGTSPLLSAVVESLLAKDPAARGFDAAALAATLRGGERSAWWRDRVRGDRERREAPSPVAVGRHTNFEGRGRERAVLRDAWDRARAGDGGTVLVEGEAGIGKSRLVDEFLRSLPAGEGTVLHGAFAAGGGRDAVAAALLARLGPSDAEARLAALMPAHRARASEFAAALRARAGTALATDIDPDVYASLLAAAFAGLARRSPVLLAIEDLHEADVAQRRTVDLLSRAGEGRPLLILATMRPGTPGVRDEFSGETGPVRRLRLARLAPSAVARILAAAFPEGLDRRAHEDLARRSDGIPLLLVELIRARRDVGADGAATGLPGTLREVVGARLAGLSADERRLLAAAAVQGVEFAADLCAAATDTPLLGVLQGLAEIQRRTGVVRAEGADWRFDHALLHEAALAALDPAERRRYHARVAAAIETFGTAGGTPLPAALAARAATHHLRGETPAAALPHVEPGLDDLAAGLRHEAVAELAGEALAVPAMLVGVARARVLARRAASLLRLGRGAEAVADVEAALAAVAEAPGDPGAAGLEAAFRRGLGTALDRVGDTVRARAVLAEALARARAAGDSAEEGRVEGTLGEVLSRAGKHPRALERFRRALDLLPADASATAAARARCRVGDALLRLGRFSEALDAFTPALGTARDAADRDLGARALLGQAEARTALGRTAEALDLLASVGEHARASADRALEADALLAEARARALAGDRAGARAAASAARDLGRGAASPRVEGHAALLLAEAAADAGDAAAARDGAAEAFDLLLRGGDLEGVAGARLLQARLAEADGDRDGAAALLLGARRLGDRLGLPRVQVVAAARTAALAAGSAPATAAAREAVDTQGPLLPLAAQAEARFLLFKAEGQADDLSRAREAVRRLRRNAPEEWRRSVVEDVPLHAAIEAAWEAMERATRERGPAPGRETPWDAR